MAMLPRVVSRTPHSLSRNANNKSYRSHEELGSRLPGPKSCGEAIGRDQFHLLLMRSSGALPPRPLEKSKGDVMQIQTCKRLIMLSVLGVLTTVSAHAQYVKPFRVTIPFNFYVGGKALTAGQYTVGRGSETTAEAIVLRGIDGGAGVFVLTRGIQTAEVQQQSKLVFRRYGDQYFLGEVWTFLK